MKANKHYKKLISAILGLTLCHSAFSQAQLFQLHNDLRKTNSPEKKADICFTISIWHSDKLKIDSGVFYANKIKEHSQQTGYRTGLGKHYYALALALHYRSRNDEAEKNTLKAIEIFTSLKETLLVGRSNTQLARIQQSVNNNSAAKKNYWTAINYLISSKDHNGLFRNYFWLGRMYKRTSEIDSATFYYVKALETAEVLHDDKRILETACEVGECYLLQEDLEKAYKYLSYGLNKRTALSDKVGVRYSLEKYAIVLILLHNFNRADSAIKEFELMNVTLNDAWGKMALNRIIGRFEYEQKNYQKALKYFQQAYKGIGEVKVSDNDVKEIVFLLGKAEFDTHDYRNAIIHLQTAGKLAQEVRHVFDVMEADLLLSKAYEKQGKADSALFYFRKYSVLKDSVLSVQKQKNIFEITTRYETAKKEQEIKILLKEGEANTYLLQLKNEQLIKQQLQDEQKSQQLDLISKQSEINKLDADQKSLSLDIEKKENERRQSKLKLLETEAAYQKLLVSKQNQQKKIVYAGIASILILGGYALYRYVRKKQLQNQEVVLNERLRISRELHDEVGSTLSGLAMYSHLTRQQMKASKTEEVEKSLNTMQQSAGEMVGKLNDIVWLVNPEKDSLQKLIERLEEYAVEMAIIKNIEVKTNLSYALKELNLPVESRRNIYLFCKEAINNAVKYSEADLLELAIKETDNKKIAISISDNGKGFNMQFIKKGNGLNNMRERANKMNGEFLLQSQPGLGTIITCTCKIT